MERLLTVKKQGSAHHQRRELLLKSTVALRLHKYTAVPIVPTVATLCNRAPQHEREANKMEPTNPNATTVGKLHMSK